METITRLVFLNHCQFMRSFMHRGLTEEKAQQEWQLKLADPEVLKRLSA